VQILGSGMSTKIWEVAVEHAKTTCIKSDKVHIYYLDSPSKTAVVFNVVGEVTGLISEKFVPVDDLTEKEKVFSFFHLIIIHITNLSVFTLLPVAIYTICSYNMCSF
jgi:hypothetical protein